MTIYLIITLTALFLLILYFKIKRNFKYRKFSKSKIAAQTLLITIITILVFQNLNYEKHVINIITAILTGILISIISISKTYFKKEENNYLFKSNLYIEASIFAIIICRFSYRMYQLNNLVQQPENINEDRLTEFQNPVNIFSFVFLITYLTAYKILLTKKIRKLYETVK